MKINNEMCPYYKTGRKCTNKKYCIEQAGFDDCMSYLYYAKDLEQQLKRKEEECEEWKGIASQYKLEKVKIQNRYQQLTGSYNKAESYNQALTEIENLCKDKAKEDICVECKCFENGKECFECDYEEHRNELYNGNTAYNLGLNILQIIQKAKGE